MVTSIESVEDLASHPQMKYGLVRGGSTQAFFEVIICFLMRKNNFVFL